MIYKVDYTKVAIMKDGSTGNISRGADIAYMNCKVEDVKPYLASYLLKSKECPIISNIKHIKGHLIKETWHS